MLMAPNLIFDYAHYFMGKKLNREFFPDQDSFG